MPRTRRIVGAVCAILIGSALWLPALHLFFRKPASDFYRVVGISPTAKHLAARHLNLWNEPGLREREVQRMRASNAEWDFMGRSFLVWSLANMGLRDPVIKESCLGTMDRIIDETVRLEKEKGMYFFLMPYARANPFVAQPAHSLFLDGEIALMLASRQMLEARPDYQALLAERIDGIVQRIELSRTLAVESYPNECWMFDHIIALDAIRLTDQLLGTSHQALIQRWLEMAKQKLVHRESGLLVSNFTIDLKPMDGPEGSSLWMIAHGLQLLDPDFARVQYERARRELGRTTLGFSYAREWPASWVGRPDIDSGPLIPFFNISAGASGMAFIGAAAFNDNEFLASLSSTLDFAAFPSRHGGRLKYCASNQVGDAALLYAATLGPVWQKAIRGGNL